MLKTSCRMSSLESNTLWCSICLDLVPASQIFTLSGCSHEFCKYYRPRECMSNYIKNSPPIITELECPLSSCQIKLSQHEMKTILGDQEFERRRQLSRFNCITYTCQGFFFISNDQFMFECTLCSRTSCAKCNSLFFSNHKAKTHDCDEILASKTDHQVQCLIESGMIMRCPNCKIPIEKTDSGCQFARCYMCKMDICCVTRQARWGPSGRGDTSAGCKCGVDGKKCHPDCVNCH